MQRLRSIWVLRFVVALLVVSLGPTIAGATVQAAPDSAGAYAEWLEHYLREPGDPIVKQALEKAGSSHAATFDRFMRVFVDVYEAQHPAEPLEQIFSLRAQTTDALVRLLYGQYQQKLGGTTVPQGTISATPSLFLGVTDRALFVLPEAVSAARIGRPSVSSFACVHEGHYVLPVRVSWSAFPQGP